MIIQIQHPAKTNLAVCVRSKYSIKTVPMLNKNPILATALNATIGYETGAQIVKKAYNEKRSIIDVASEMTDLDSDTLSQILDPVKLTRNQ